MSDRKEQKIEKINLHPNNKHRSGYDFKGLQEVCSALKPFVKPNKYGNESIDFANPEAVKMLNKSLLMKHYGVTYWDFPEGYLCPPIPGRVDYIHHVSSLINNEREVKVLDVGVGSSCIYPILGIAEYNWSFVGVDIDKEALVSAQEIIKNNKVLTDKIQLRFQENANSIFEGVVKKSERFDLCICNPPFHASMEEAEEGNLRKLNNLNSNRITAVKRNFGGREKELSCQGGEKAFITRMINESIKFKYSFGWFSTLVSKQSNLKGIYGELKLAGVHRYKTMNMGQGQKTSRIVAWTFKVDS